MGVAKKYQLYSKDKQAKTQDETSKNKNQEDKRVIQAYQKKIEEMVKDKATAQKAALILERFINQSKK